MTELSSIHPEFLPAQLAETMRNDIVSFFDSPYEQNETHQVWNYWHVPGMYTYFRTDAHKVINSHALATLNHRLSLLGLGDPTTPFLSMYLPGCRQGIHNDTENGKHAFVYSLTSDDRQTWGGCTLVFKPDAMTLGVRAGAGVDFYDEIEPKFNQLVVFDDRIPHAVSILEGSHNPIDARFVLHGHFC